MKALLRTLVALTVSPLSATSLSADTVAPTFPKYRDEVATILQPAPTIEEAVEPLVELIGKAESDSVGGYDAANNGQAMDLGNSGVLKVFGRPASEVTVGEFLLAQAQHRIHAVGRYQIIGVTLRELVDSRCISGAELFTDDVQDRAFLCLIKQKRPAIWHYISTGQGLTRAANALALEWASMPWTHGGTAYGAGDRAHATRAQVFAVLERVRRKAAEVPELLQ